MLGRFTARTVAIPQRVLGTTKNFSTTTPSSVASVPYKPAIRKKIPLPTNLADASNKLLVNTYARPSPVFVKGEGIYLFDTEGKKYIDFTAGIAVNALGHSDPAWIAAITEQAKKLSHVSNLYHTEASVALAHTLISNSNFDRVFFANSGTEANEAALKFARKWAKSVDNSGKKTEYVAFTNGFSGRSMGALSCTHKAKYREYYNPLIPGVSFSPFNDLDAASKVITDNTAAVIVEPTQGEGGITPATIPFLRGLRELTTKHKALLIVDEVQCGIGRVGRLWAHEAYDIQPDIMTLAKPLAGGLPIGAALVTENVASQINPGDHGSTYAGNPLVTAVAKHVFERISQESFLSDVREKGAYLVDKVKGLNNPHVKEIRTPGGLFIGVEFDVPVKNLVNAALENGLLLVNAGENVLRLCPPLTVTKQEIDETVRIIGECMKSL